MHIRQAVYQLSVTPDCVYLFYAERYKKIVAGRKKGQSDERSIGANASGLRRTALLSTVGALSTGKGHTGKTEVLGGI